MFSRPCLRLPGVPILMARRGGKRLHARHHGVDCAQKRAHLLPEPLDKEAQREG